MTSSKQALFCRRRRRRECDDVTAEDRRRFDGGDDDDDDDDVRATWSDDVIASPLTGCSAARSLTSFPPPGRRRSSTWVQSKRPPGSGRPAAKSKPQRAALTAAREARSAAAASAARSARPNRHRQVPVDTAAAAEELFSSWVVRASICGPQCFTSVSMWSLTVSVIVPVSDVLCRVLNPTTLHVRLTQALQLHADLSLSLDQAIQPARACGAQRDVITVGGATTSRTRSAASPSVHAIGCLSIGGRPALTSTLPTLA